MKTERILYFLVPPKIWIQYQLVGAYDGQRITLQCNSEAFPTSINYWAKNNGEIITQSRSHTQQNIFYAVNFVKH